MATNQHIKDIYALLQDNVSGPGSTFEVRYNGFIFWGYLGTVQEPRAIWELFGNVEEEGKIIPMYDFRPSGYFYTFGNGVLRKIATEAARGMLFYNKGEYKLGPDALF